MLKIIVVLILLLSSDSTCTLKNCFAFVHHDKNNNISFVLEDAWSSTKPNNHEYYQALFDPALTIFITGNKYTTAYYVHSENDAKKLTGTFYKNLQSTIKANKADFGLFTLTKTNLNTLSVYVKAEKNQQKDFCVLEPLVFEAHARKYMEELKREGFENVIYVDSGGVQCRNMTIEVAGYRTKDNKAVVKRIVSRYGRIVELTGYFTVPRQKIDEFENYLEGIEEYFDHIAYGIDYDNCIIIDESKDLWRFKEI
ncbi:MAG: hypothetical protein IJ601_08565 [Acidaminococcaceae bacterium]|nr:hypothetical protein [Acidaminococcaceae bacterium]